MSLVWRALLLAIGCGCAIACRSDDVTPATQFIVAITSDLTPATQLSRIHVNVSSRDGKQVASNRDLLIVADPKTSNEYALPITLSVSFGTQKTFLLEVTGYGPGSDKVIVEHRSLATFESGKTLLLQVFLGSICVGQDCAEDRICSPIDGPDTQAGGCVALQEFDRSNTRAVNVSMLPDLTLSPPGAASADAGKSADASMTAEAGMGADASMTADAGMTGDANMTTDSGMNADAGMNGDSAIAMDTGTPVSCASSPELCDVHAQCGEPGPRCRCNSGYMGDGSQCDAIDSCNIDHGGCAEHATCTSTGPATNICDCDSGYSGNGTHCTAIDACAMNHGGCNPVLPCVSTGPGTRDCVTVSQVATGDNFTCAMLSDHSARCWGQNQLGQLGHRDAPAQSATPLAVTDAAGATLKNISRIAAGTHFACAIAGGGLFCWGDNASGQLGDGTTQGRTVPMLSLQNGTTDLALAHDHSCARTTTGQVACWGANPYGQLGNGTTTDSSVPVVALSSGATVVSASVSNTCAIANGDVWCWGVNYYGQLADGTTTDYHVPHKSLVTGAAALAVAASYGCAVLSSGELRCWGRNNVGQLGLGNTTDQPTPTRVIASGVATACTTIAEDEPEHTCAVMTSGELRCWGSNLHGQLGDGSTMDRSSPMTVLASGARQVACGPRHTCAVMDDGTLRCWGSNVDGATAGSSPQVPVLLNQ